MPGPCEKCKDVCENCKCGTDCKCCDVSKGKCECKNEGHCTCEECVCE